MTFGARVRELRKAEGLSQRVLAERLEINFTYLSKIESGNRSPDLGIGTISGVKRLKIRELLVPFVSLPINEGK